LISIPIPNKDGDFSLMRDEALKEARFGFFPHAGRAPTGAGFAIPTLEETHHLQHQLEEEEEVLSISDHFCTRSTRYDGHEE